MKSNHDDAPRIKGRPRRFDRNKALTQALNVFWRRGYEPASITELCQAMEINPPSLYSAFGNKAKLFLEAVTFYEKTYWETPSQKLLSAPDIRKGMAAFFKEAAHILVSSDSPCGCMVVLAAINVSEDSKDIVEAIREIRMATKNMFAEVLQRGVKDGQLPSDTEVVPLAGAFNSLLEGLSLHARDGLSQDEMESIAAYAVRLLPEMAYSTISSSLDTLRV